MEFRFLIGSEIVEAEKQLPVEQRAHWPVDSMVMYCYEDDRIVGRMGVMSLKIIEGTWIAPDKRSTTLPLRVLRQFEAMYAAYLGENLNAFASEEQPEIADYLSRVGFERVPVNLFTKTLVQKKEAA